MGGTDVKAGRGGFDWRLAGPPPGEAAGDLSVTRGQSKGREGGWFEAAEAYVVATVWTLWSAEFLLCVAAGRGTHRGVQVLLQWHGCRWGAALELVQVQVHSHAVTHRGNISL